MLVGIEASAGVARPRTGVGHYVANLMAGLRRVASHDVKFVYFSNRFDPVAARDGIVVDDHDVYARDRLPSTMLWMQLGLPRSMTRTAPDVCHFPNYLTPLSSTRRVAGVVTLHDMSVYRYPQYQPRKTVLIHRAMLPIVARSRHTCITVSESARRDAMECLKLPEERVRVVYEGVDPQFHASAEAGDGETRVRHGLAFPYVLSVGTLEPRKNQARLIDAFASLVRQEHLPHHLVLTGADGWRDGALRARMQNRDVAGRIHHLGYVPFSHLPALYRGADAFAFPSLYEGFGLPALEALACGTPTMISTAPALVEVAGEAAMAVNPYHVDDIASGLQRLLSDHDLAGTLRDRGIERSRQFTWDRCAIETLAIYREMIPMRRRMARVLSSRSGESGRVAPGAGSLG